MNQKEPQNKLKILYEDSDIIVCEKPHGIATQTRDIRSADMVSLLKNHICQSTGKNEEPYLSVIHRLDQPVRGILVFGKTRRASAALNGQLQNQGFGKYYRALVSGHPPKSSDILENYLVRDGRSNTSRICGADTKDAKLARLSYQIVTPASTFWEAAEGQTELEIHLDTGRHHQIRVQLSQLGCPIVGDTKYGASPAVSSGRTGHTPLCLAAFRLDFTHPSSGKPMHFQLTI